MLSVHLRYLWIIISVFSDFSFILTSCSFQPRRARLASLARLANACRGRSNRASARRARPSW